MQKAKEPFYVAQFSLDTLGALIKECFGESFPDIREKRQVRYLFDYLRDLGARTIVCETDYVDRGYLEDFSNYYVSCFGGYKSTCARLHFFSSEFDHRALHCLISGAPGHDDKTLCLIPRCSKTGSFETQSLWCEGDYLGFSVIKPIPKTFVGRTCLAPYPQLVNQFKRNVVKRECKANLFGVKLVVNSVAFQEQDKVISACVTSALWSIFHGLPHINRQRLTSPSEITLAAVSDGRAEINSFPTKGLSNAEIVKALNGFKLKHHALDVDDMLPDTCFDLCRAMIDSHHPVLLGGAIFSKGESGAYCYRGEHAVAVLGYSCDEGQERRLYVHDDRWGPYVRADLKEESVKDLVSDEELERFSRVNPGSSSHSLERIPSFYFRMGRTEKPNQAAKIDELFVPNIQITPCYKKVRIPPDVVYDACDCIASFARSVLEEEGVSESDDSINIEKEICLELSNNLKKRVWGDSWVVNRKEVLLTHMPRFVWVASVQIQGQKGFEFVIDATDIQNGRPLICTVEYATDKKDGILPLIRSSVFKSYLEGLEDDAKVSFTKQLRYGVTSSVNEAATHLDRVFGPLRAPRYIKPTEISDDNDIVAAAKASSMYFDYEPDEESEALSVLKGAICLGIWVVLESGALMVGPEKKGEGHPTLTGASSARIGGEIAWSREDACFYINAQSGRYSGNYDDEESEIYLSNALKKFRMIFGGYKFEIGDTAFFKCLKEKICEAEGSAA